jgi:hypothetical protein
MIPVDRLNGYNLSCLLYFCRVKNFYQRIFIKTKTMKKLIVFIAVILLRGYSLRAQSKVNQQMVAVVAQLDRAVAAKDYQQLASVFESIALQEKTNWLPYYYAAFCNAKIGWLYQQDGDKIKPFADKAEMDIKKSSSLLNTVSQKKELSEVYCVFSMVNRARVFISPMNYGRQYGPAASQYTHLALQTNPDNPRANYLLGWEKYSTPGFWGGDKKKARELLDLAKQQLNATSASNDGINPHWGQREVAELLKELK